MSQKEVVWFRPKTRERYVKYRYKTEISQTYKEWFISVLSVTDLWVTSDLSIYDPYLIIDLFIGKICIIALVFYKAGKNAGLGQSMHIHWHY